MNKFGSLLGKFLTWPFKLFPVKKNRVYFISRNGYHYACNPRALFEYLYANHKDEFEFYYCLNKNAIGKELLPKDVKTASYMSLKDLYYIHTSQFVFTNCRLNFWFSKRRKQKYFQLWHDSAIELKKIEGDIPTSRSYRYLCKHDGSMIDYLTVGSEQRAKLMENSFKISKDKFFLSGNPRADILFNYTKQELLNIRKNLGLKESDFVVLYAPTFRDNQQYTEMFLDNEAIKKALEKFAGGGDNVKILYRFHPHKLPQEAKDMKFKEDYILNVCQYPEMQELLIASDMLITDFSGCMFDMMLMNKPCVLYLNDCEKYINEERGVYMPIKELPFPQADTCDELVDVLKNADKSFKDLPNKYKAFSKKYGVVEDGHARERIYKCMVDINKNNKD